MPKTKKDSATDFDVHQPCLTALLRAATHELNTPLAVLQNYTELLAPLLSGQEAEAHLAVIRRELARLVSVVDDLSLRNELENGTLAFRVAPIDTESLLSDLAATVEAQHPARVVTFCYQGQLPCVNVDPDRLRFILRTLLHNAARYSPRAYKAITLTIRPSSFAGAGALDFSVPDAAPSLLPKYGEKVFVPMPEMPQALRRPKFGLGMGLYAAREMARRMGGDLWVEQGKGRRGKPGTGNVFVLRLPLAEGCHE